MGAHEGLRPVSGLVEERQSIVREVPGAREQAVPHDWRRTAMAAADARVRALAVA